MRRARSLRARRFSLLHPMQGTSALRAYALRLPPGDRPCGPIPAALRLAPLQDRRKRLSLIGLRAWRRCALRLRGAGADIDPCRTRRHSRVHHLVRDCSPRPCAVKTRRAVSSTGACGPHQPGACFLDGPCPRALDVSGDELRKDGDNGRPGSLRRPHRKPGESSESRNPARVLQQPTSLEKDMQLASRFASYSPVLRLEQPLSDDQIRTVDPSIFTAAPHDSSSHRYSDIPTATVLHKLRGEASSLSWRARPACGRKGGATSPSTCCGCDTPARSTAARPTKSSC